MCYPSICMVFYMCISSHIPQGWQFDENDFSFKAEGYHYEPVTNSNEPYHMGEFVHDLALIKHGITFELNLG